LISIYIFFIFINFLFSVIFIFLFGVKKNYLYSFIVFIQFIYLFNTPLHRFQIEDFMAINTNVKDYFDFGFLIILIHLTIFNFAYIITPQNRKYVNANIIINEKESNKKVYNIFLILYSLIFINTLYGGVNLLLILYGKSDTTTLGFAGGSYYIQNLADSLITLLVLTYALKMPNIKKYSLFFLGFTLFIILGFRYRILLTVFAIVLFNFAMNGIKLIKFFQYLTFIFVFLYSLLFLTFNRVQLYSAKYDDLNFNPSSFNYDVFYDQAKGSLVDFAIYKALDNKIIESDHGQTMFVYIFIKMLPSSFFNNNTKPYPPPQLKAIDKSINAGRDIGEASTALGSVYYAFNFIGIVIFSFLFGLIIKRLTIFNAPIFSIVFTIMIVMAIFQFFTRGYFPQFIDHLAYMLFPFLFFRKQEIKVI